MKIFWLHPDGHVGLNDEDFYKFFQSEGATDINEKLVTKWFDMLADFNANFVTLNPQILNWLDDDFAKEFIYVKTKSGFKKLGDVERVQFKFKCLGPGEVVCDTDFSILD